MQHRTVNNSFWETFNDCFCIGYDEINLKKNCFIRDRRVNYGRLHFFCSDLCVVNTEPQTTKMKQSQWTFEVHKCLCFSQRLRRFNRLLQLPNGYKSATLKEKLTGLQNKPKHPTIKKTNHWNFWVTWNNFRIEVNQDITHILQQSISWLVIIQEPLCADRIPQLVPAIHICWKRK